MQAAYKMKEASAKAPKLEVRRGDASRRAAARRQNMARGLLALTMLALVCAVIYSHVQLTELTGEIQDARVELTAAYWNNTLDSKTNLRTVEEAATTRLGMIKADPSQITYIKLDETSTVDRPASGLQKLAGMLHAGALSLVGSLDP